MRNRGSVLLITLLVALLLSGMAAALLTLSVGTEKDVREELLTGKSFYLAESGISASIHELIDGTDAGGDGLGSMARSVNGGTYQVTATPRDSEYDLIILGTSDGYRSRLGVTLVPIFKGISPMGAIGVSGILPPPDRIDMINELSHNAWIDGGSHPAVTIQDHASYTDFLHEIAVQIRARQIDPDQFTGDPDVPVTVGGSTYQLPFQQMDHPGIDAELLEMLRSTLYTAVRTNIIPAANRTFTGIRTLNANSVWGTETSPEITVIQDDLHIGNGVEITGSGTLVVLGRLNMEHLSSLRWKGDIYVLGGWTPANDAWFRNDGARVDIDGNFILIENDAGSAMMGHVPHEAEHRDIPDIHTTINGNFLLMKGTWGGGISRITLPCGTLTVNGLLAMNGEKISIEHLPDANFIVNGSLQAGLLNGVRLLSTFRLKLLGPTHITFDEDLVMGALEKLGKLIDTQLDVATKKQLLGYTKKGWRRLPAE